MASKLARSMQAAQPPATSVGSVVNHFPLGTLRSGVCTTTLLVLCMSHLFVSAETESKCLAKDSKLLAILKQYQKYVECNLSFSIVHCYF